MAHPIYRFGEILRELRKGAGLTVLGAAEATEYGNYERWESGATRVGAQHLGAIAEAFAVDDVPMFLYAWLVDRFSPAPKQSGVDLAQLNFARTYRQLPRTTVDLGERKDWVVQSPRHADLSLLYLVARYRRNQRVVLPPVARRPLPAGAEDEGVLTAAYGDVIEDVVRLAARILLRAGRSDDVDARATVANIAPMLSKPEAFEALADRLPMNSVGSPLCRVAFGTASLGSSPRPETPLRPGALTSSRRDSPPAMWTRSHRPSLPPSSAGRCQTSTLR